MRKNKPILLFLLFTLVTNSCTSSPRPIPYLHNGQKWDKSIVILGDWDCDPTTPDTYLHWAPVNAGYDVVGEVASKDDHRLGRLYQWGSGDSETNKVAKERYYNETKPKFWYTEVDMESKYTGGKWNNGNGPCPKGWRLPTAAEFKCLTLGRNDEYGWSTCGKYAGFDSYTGAEFFGLNKEMTPGTGVFLPAPGIIHSTFGNAMSIDSKGFYWTDEAETINNGPAGNYARALSAALKITKEGCEIVPARHSNGFSVRCVHDVQ